MRARHRLSRRRLDRATLLAFVGLPLSACAWQGSVGWPSPQPQPQGRQGGHLVVINGQLVEEPPTPVEIVIEGMEQANRLRRAAQSLNGEAFSNHNRRPLPRRLE